MKDRIQQNLLHLFINWADEKAQQINPLPLSGSSRQYYRITSENTTAIGVYNNDSKENRAFLSFSRDFKKAGLPVPEIHAENNSENIYLVEDLGDTTLYSYLTKNRTGNALTPKLIDIYKNVISYLPKFQFANSPKPDFSVCYPRVAFDRQSILWDLNYFKYYFLKLADIPFDEQELENDFNSFIEFLLTSDYEYFMYRDFQSRNIMLVNDQPYFIDYQGGRKGALQYDLASLLYDGKADLPNSVRDELLVYYIAELKNYIDFDETRFIEHFYGFVLIRIMQAMGAYGYRGFFQGKTHFLLSIPYALRNIENMLQRIKLPVKIPVLLQMLDRITKNEGLQKIGQKPDRLTIDVCSFSYRKGLPADYSGNGGGFIFDCRALHNPGRYEPYKKLTGRDKAVIDFLEEKSKVKKFLSRIFELIDNSVESYIERKYTNLMIAFGCTGGQHRSVYSAEHLAKHLEEKYPQISVNLVHRELS